MVRGFLAAGGLAAAVAGCGSGPTGGSETPYDLSFTDPMGDTLVATINPDSVRAVDLLTTSVRVDSDRLELTLTFAEPIAKWSDRAANSLDGFVYFDTDQAAGSGRSNQIGPRVIGADFYLDLRDDGTGVLALVGFLKKTITRLPARFEGATLRIEVPRSAISSATDADNKLNLRIEVGVRGRSPLVDAADNDSVYVLEPPVAP